MQNKGYIKQIWGQQGWKHNAQMPLEIRASLGRVLLIKDQIDNRSSVVGMNFFENKSKNLMFIFVCLL